MKVDVQPDWTLLRFLRDQLRLTGTKYGCGEGHCGACTVIVNGNAKRSCLLKTSGLAEARIETIEGLGTVEELHPIQEAFIEFGCVQCGYCTPGLIMATKALLDRNPSPSREDIQRSLAGNLCRCGGYLRVIEAVQSLAKSVIPQDSK
jgi:aerobic-type carbon monoxide dehydrogenase small subunit (CoxS/CutS family)